MPLEHAILGFLEYGPMTGYDLKKYFDQSIAHFWSATQSHIYKALENLEKDGFVEFKVIPQDDKPNRKEYRITPAGRSELQRWLTTPLLLEPVRESWLIQIFFSTISSNEEIASLFEARMKEIQERLKVYKEDAQAALDRNANEMGIERARELWQITLDYGIAFYEFELKWDKRMLERVNNLPALKMPKSK